MARAGATVVLPLHLQNEVIHPEGAIHAGFGGPEASREAFLAAARAVLDRSRRAGLPIVYVRMAFQPGGTDLPENCELYRTVKRSEAMREGSWGVEFMAGLEPILPADRVISHNRVNAFYDSDLETTLDSLNCAEVVLFGVATHSVVEHTARHAADMGLGVTIVEDACSAYPRERHEASLAAIANLVTRVTAEALEFGNGHD
jgi:nicotinamidase-related amidase